MANEIILVAGVDYPEYLSADSHRKTWKLARAIPSESRRWRTYCERWAIKVAKETNDPRNLRITLFDFTRGTRENLAIDKAGRITVRGKKDYGSLTPGNYRRVDDSQASDAGDTTNIKFVPIHPNETIPWRQRPGVYYFPGLAQKWQTDTVTQAAYTEAYKRSQLIEKSLGITDVYEYICSFGSDKTKAYTLKELHFFAHGWFGGPILINTLDLRLRLLGEKGLERDPLDKDARSELDFVQFGGKNQT